MTGSPSGDSTRSTSAARVDDIARATEAWSAIDALVAHFGVDATLYVVDHAVEQLVPVREQPGATVEQLVGGLRRSVLRAEPHRDESWTWHPIPERDQTVFVVRLPTEAAEQQGATETDLLLGAVLGGHRTRFESLERHRRRQQMSIAAELQWDFLPLRGEFFDGFAVAGVLEPAYDVAGDAFDYAWNDGALWAYSFDGMGHGLGATLTSVVALAAVRNARRGGEGLAAQMDAASAAVHDQWHGDRFVTGIACRIDGASLEFVNAGHEPVRIVVDGSASTLEIEAELPLGVIADHGYSAQRRAGLGNGDGLVLFSDGPSNATDVDGTNFGDDRLLGVLEANWSDRPMQTAHDAMGDVLAFIGEGDVNDDLTAVVIRRAFPDTKL